NNNFHGGTRHITEIKNFNPNLLSNSIIDPQRLTGQHQRHHPQRLTGQHQRHHSQSDVPLNDYIDQLSRKS
ncbi:unnamed protein product, partial [Rotaria magnacalcarata]